MICGDKCHNRLRIYFVDTAGISGTLRVWAAALCHGRFWIVVCEKREQRTLLCGGQRREDISPSLSSDHSL